MNIFLKEYLKLILLLMLLGNIYPASAVESKKERPSINILTWWGYLSYPEIISIAEKECKVNISFDEYFSNDEFLRRWEAHRDYYDIIIFSDTVYNVVKNKIPHLKNSTLWKQSDNYNPIIKFHFNKSKYFHNVAYFAHTLTGFLWNPSNIQLSKDDSIISIFKNASQKLVVIMDDPIEAKKLIESSLVDRNKKYSEKEILTISQFKNISQQATIYITNNYSQIYKKPEFAFSFSWSGEAIYDLMESNKQYKFLIHPKLSYISSDLIAQTSTKKASLCVAKILSGKKMSLIFQEKGFYFSPYLDHSNITNVIFKKVYENFIFLLPNLSWINSINEADFRKISNSWQLIKLSLNNHRRGTKNGNYR